jgi:predicted dehydrogenase
MDPMVLNDKQRQVGKDNFNEASRYSRRQVLTGAVAIPAVAGLGWGYTKLEGPPVKPALLGTGDPGCYAHISQSNPDYIDIVAFSDIRPSSQRRARRLFAEKYGDKAKNVQLYEDYRKMLDERDDVELVIIATPLFLHSQMTIDALERDKHVLCEKLMAKTVQQCKDMVRKADEKKKLLAVGHQRHYSYLYANALSIIQQKDILGDIRHIRAFWHRNQVIYGDSWTPAIPKDDLEYYSQHPDELKDYGYEDIEQLIRWRLDNTTGGGLMVELGSHQLDAASIFLGHKLPVAVHGTGVLSYFSKDSRDINDHVFLIYEFGPDANETVVTYSSISTNAYDGYGEQVMGTRGTMILEKEMNAYVFREGAGPDTRITWAESHLSRPTTSSGSTAAWASGVSTADTLTSRGYREEQEHMAWLIRNPDKITWPSEANHFLMPCKENDYHPDLRFFPRCHGRVALNDAVVTLVSNLAMAKKQRVEYKPEWFDVNSDATPEQDLA